MKKLNIILFGFLVSLFSFSCDDIFQESPPEIPVINPLGSRTINSIDVVWSKYSGDDFDRYEVYFRRKFAPDYRLYSTLKNERQTYITVSDLEPKTEYQFYVRSIDKKGQYSNSEVYKLETLNDQPSPVKVFDVNNSDLSYQSIKLIWSPYADDFAVPFLKYEVYCSSYPNFSENYTKKMVLTDLSPAVVINFLVEKTTYYCKIHTYNILQKYSVSNIIAFMTLPAPPDVVSLSEPFDVTETTAKIKWTKSNDTGFSKYQVHLGDYLSFEPDNSNLFKVLYSSDSTSFSLTNLKKKWEYFIMVVVYKNNKTFSISNIQGLTVYPGGGPIPVNIIDPNPALEEIKTNRIWIKWTPSISRFISKYEVQILEPYSTIWKFAWKWAKGVDQYLMDGSIPTSCIINNLKANSTYSFRVMIYTELVKYSYSPVKTYTTLP